MGANKMDQALAAIRREMVAGWHAQGLTQRRIVVRLAECETITDPETGERVPFLNPDTGRPWGLTVVNKDIQALEKQWRKAASDKIDRHKGETLARYNEIYRQTMAKGEMSAAISALNGIRGLLGLDSPARAPVDETGKTVRDAPDWTRVMADAMRLAGDDSA